MRDVPVEYSLTPYSLPLTTNKKMNYDQIIDLYYSEDATLRRILVEHSECVTRRALLIADRHPELCLDRNFLIEASMLHDIGIIHCDAPGIHCYGTEPYIRHGIMGAKMLRAHGLERHARVCERHTGAGISMDDILAQDLPLPLGDYLPETLEEQVICYADKFYSKSHLEREKTVEQALRSLAKFGEAGVERFKRWSALFE